LQKLSTDIKFQLNNLTGKNNEMDNWENTINNLISERKKLIGQIQEQERQLDKLDVDESDYLQEDTGMEYSQEKYDNISSEIDSIKKQKENQEKDLNDLKQELCISTGDDHSIPWEVLIDNLRKKRFSIQEEYKNLTAEILAGIKVMEVIKKLREEEDSKIQRGLESKTVQSPLFDLTKRYKQITLNEDQLIVSDDYNNFSLSDISTGAQEQVMLALRIGFSAKLLKKDKLFLILDDAFQHSHWKRRANLVDQLVQLAEKGWQIIYLTMDDHIRDLFDNKGKRLGDAYKRIDLS